MASIRTWTQANGIEIEEVDYDYDAHAFEIFVDGRRVVTIYADSPEQTEDMRASLDAGEDVRDWEDGNGNCVGTLIMETVKIIKEISKLCDAYRMRRIKMTHKSEIEIEEEIKMIRDKCKDCWLRKHCIISQTVEKNLNHSETGYGVEEAVISFWNDCCPYINRECPFKVELDAEAE